MSKPDWKGAPEWANVLVSQNGFGTTVYCWASGFHDQARARWSEDPAHMEFNLFKSCWDLLESRP